jgi:hypothetical protein
MKLDKKGKGNSLYIRPLIATGEELLQTHLMITNL